MPRRCAALLLTIATACEGPPAVPPVEGVIGPAGGALESGGVRLDVPAGAVDEEVAFTIEPISSGLSIGWVVVVGPAVRVGPAGVGFSTPATLTLPYREGELPAAATPAQIAVYTAETTAGPFERLASTAAAGSVRAALDHLSVFVAGVPDPRGDPVGIPPCPAHVDDCGCDAEHASRPLSITGRADLGRPIWAVCLSADALRVTSYVPSGSPDPFAEPAEVWDTRLALPSLAVLDTTRFEGGLRSTEICQPDDRAPFLEGTDGDVRFSVRYVEHEDARTGERQWFEAILTVASPRGAIDYSFNRHLNPAAPWRDGHFLWDRENGLDGRVRPDGSASFYLHVWHSGHVDAIHVADLGAVLADPTGHLDGDGLGIPTSRERVELWDDPLLDSNAGYSFDPLVLVPAGDDPAADVLLAFSPGGSGIQALRNEPGGRVTRRLADLGLDEFWSQGGWHDGGIVSGLLYVESNVASFTNSVLLAIDPVEVAVRRRWEIGCIHAPSAEGFRALADGQLLRFGWSSLDERTFVMFVRDGDVPAIGEVPFVSVRPISLVSPDERHVYVAHRETGAVTAIATP